MKTNNHRTGTHRILETLAWLALLAALGVAVYGACTLSGEIATHYTLDGTPNRWGTPTSLLLLPLLMLIPCGLLSLAAHFLPPQSFNTPFAVREENAPAVYRVLLTLLHALQLEIALFALCCTCMSCWQQSSIVPPLLFLAALAVTVIGLTAQAAHMNKK